MIFLAAVAAGFERRIVMNKERAIKKTRILFLAALINVLAVMCVSAQTGDFTYQGKLTDTGVSGNGLYDFTFKLYDSLTNGTQIGSDVVVGDLPVSNGIFTADLDFGTAALTGGAPRFLEISVRAGASTGAYTILAPRQPLSSAPFAVKSLISTSADGLSAACNLCVTDGHIQSLSGSKLTGVITGDGSGITNINGGNVTSQSITSTQIAPESLPNTTTFKLLGSLRWDLLKGQNSFSVGSNPVSIAFDGANMWVSNQFSNSVTKLRVSDGSTLGTFPMGSNLIGLAFDGANIWVASAGQNRVFKLRAIDGTVQGVFSVGSTPIGVAFDGANIWVTNNNSNNVTKLRASDGAALATFTVGALPEGLAFDGANIWVANTGSANVTKLRVSDGAVQGTFSVGAIPRQIAFDGANVWVVNGSSNNVTKLRASDGALQGTFAVGSNPDAVAFDGTNIWVANQNDNNVTKLRASDGANLGTFPVGSSGPRALAFDGANIWVANQNFNNVTRLMPAFPQ